MTTLKFTKMHGLGNDFMVIDGVRQNVSLTTSQIQQLSRRDTGVGFDQCLLVEASQQPNVDFYYRIFNANGQEVGQCGNGARCLALFIQQQQLSNKKTLTVATKTTQMILQIHADNQVAVDMGHPLFSAADIPFLPDELPLAELEESDFHVVNVGNPHAVFVVKDVSKAPVQNVGVLLNNSPSFPEQVNVGFMEIIAIDEIRLRVYERGVGETQACGSGAVAAVAIGRKFFNLAAQVTVHLLGGDVAISWDSLDSTIKLTGPASFVYEGTLQLPTLVQP